MWLAILVQFAGCVAGGISVMRVGCVTGCVSGCVAGCRGVRAGCMVGAVKKLGVSLAKYRQNELYRWVCIKLVAPELDLGVLLAADTFENEQ